MYIVQCQKVGSGRSFSVAALLLLLSAGVTACEENVAPRDPFEGPFTMYGVLSPDLLTQSIRLYPVEVFPTLGSPEQPDADVFSTDLETGERLAWRDSVLVDPNGQHEYIFWAPFRAEFGHTYRVEAVRRSDGAVSFAEARIPPPVSIRIHEEEGTAVHVLVEGEDIRGLKPEVEYVVGVLDNAGFTHRTMIPYQGSERRVAQGWIVTLGMKVDYDAIRFEVKAFNFCREVLTLRRLTLRVLVGDRVWDPHDGFFDPDILSDPSTMSNVENGFGFVGGGYRVSQDIFPSRQAVEGACFAYVW